MTQSEDVAWSALWQKLDGLQDALRKSRAVAVNSANVRDAAREVVQNYFRGVRANLVNSGVSEETLAELDQPLQELLRLSNGRNRRTSYQKIIRQLRRGRSNVEVQWELLQGSSTGHAGAGDRLSDVEQLILRTLEDMVPSAALSYRQAVADLREDTRCSYRGSACELREALREVLDHLAPDDVVKEGKGFRLGTGANRPTMRQKASFVLRARGLSGTRLQNARDATDRVEAASAALARSVYNLGSASAHSATTKEEVLHLKLYVDGVLAELLQIHSPGEARIDPAPGARA